MLIKTKIEQKGTQCTKGTSIKRTTHCSPFDVSPQRGEPNFKFDRVYFERKLPPEPLIWRTKPASRKNAWGPTLNLHCKIPTEDGPTCSVYPNTNNNQNGSTEKLNTENAFLTLEKTWRITCCMGVASTKGSTFSESDKLTREPQEGKGCDFCLWNNNCKNHIAHSKYYNEIQSISKGNQSKATHGWSTHQQDPAQSIAVRIVYIGSWRVPCSCFYNRSGKPHVLSPGSASYACHQRVAQLEMPW